MTETDKEDQHSGVYEKVVLRNDSSVESRGVANVAVRWIVASPEVRPRLRRVRDISLRITATLQQKGGRGRIKP